MNFENIFTVQAPIDDVFEALMDVQRVAPCMPGAEVLERAGDDAYKVGVKVKLGPISMLYRGQVEIVERDDAAREATMQVKAREARGQGTADARVHMSLVQQPDGTQATLATELQLSGRAASMGRGMIGDVAGRLIEEFAANLAQMLGPRSAETPAPEAVDGSRPAEHAEPGADQVAAGRTPAATVAPPAPAPPAAATPAPEPATAGGTAPPAGASPRASAALPAGKIAAGVIAGRLSNPRTLLITTSVFAAIFLAIGFAIGRRRGRI